MAKVAYLTRNNLPGEVELSSSYDIKDYNHRSKIAKWPWKVMNVGQSFLMPGKKHTGMVGQANKQYAPMKFAARSMKDGVRVWRIK